MNIGKPDKTFTVLNKDKTTKSPGKRCAVSGLLCMVCCVLCAVYGVLCPVCCVRCVVSGVLYVSGVLCTVCCVRCAVSAVCLCPAEAAIVS